MKTKTRLILILILILLVLTLSLTTTTLAKQNNQTPLTWWLTQATTSQRLTSKGSGIVWGNEIRVNSYITDDQLHPSVCNRSDGSFVVAWDGEGTGDTTGVYAKIFNSAGVALTGDILVNTYTANAQYLGSVCCRSDGSFVVVWSGDGTGDTYGVYAKIFNSAGVALTGDIRVNTITQGEQSGPSVCCRSDGSFVVTWQSDGQDQSGYGVYAKIFNSNGGELTSDILVNTYTANDQQDPSVCCRSDNSFVVVWEGEGTGDPFGVYARIFNSTGFALTSDIRVNTYTANDQQDPSVCCRSDNSFVVTWEGGNEDIYGDVFVKIFNSTGGELTSDIRVNGYNTHVQYIPSVCCRSDGSFVVIWEGEGTGGTSGVYAKIFNSTGGNTTGDVEVNTYTTDDEYYSSVCCRPDGSFVVTWCGHRPYASQWNIYFIVGHVLRFPPFIFIILFWIFFFFI